MGRWKVVAPTSGLSGCPCLHRTSQAVSAQMVESAGFADLAAQRRGTGGMGMLSTLHPEPGQGNRKLLATVLGQGPPHSRGRGLNWGQRHL